MGYLRLLLWLKWRIIWRGYARDRSAAFAIFLGLLFFVPIAIISATLFTFGVLTLPPPNNTTLMRCVLLGIYLFWLLVPLLGFALNESYDITRLFVYPLSIRQVFTGAIFGAMMDLPVLLLLPTLIGVIVGFTHSGPAFFCVTLAVSLFLFHTLAFSQAVILLSAGLLRSRRFRDITIVLISLLWVGYYIARFAFARQIAELDWFAFFHSGTWEALNYLPPGLAARAAAAAGNGEYGLALAFLAALVVITVGTVYIAGGLIRRVYAGDAVGVDARVRKAAPTETRTARAQRQLDTTISSEPTRAIFGLRLPPVVQAVSEKEVRYLRRDPMFKVAFANILYVLVAIAFGAFQGAHRGDAGEAFKPVIPWVATGGLLLTEMRFLFNIFGAEGSASAVLFLFPASRREILIGKNLTLFSALSLINLILLLFLAVLSGGVEEFGAVFCWMTLALVIFIAVGNVISIWFPYRMVMQGMRLRQQSAGQGCAYGFIYLGVGLFALLLSLPALAGLLVPTFWVGSQWFALTIPLAVLYALGLYLYSLALASPLLMRREFEIIEKLTPEG